MSNKEAFNGWVNDLNPDGMVLLKRMDIASNEDETEMLQDKLNGN